MRACAIGLVFLATTTHAFVLGGGIADKDCRLAFGGAEATDGQSGVVCTDGDPACDADGVADGSCRFAVSLCTGVAVDGCTPVEVASIAVTGLALAPPPLPSTAGACGPVTDVTVAAGSAAGATAIARSDGGDLRDIDYLNLCCRTAPGSFDASLCAVSIDPAIAGCREPLPAAVVRKLTRARDGVLRARANPDHARVNLRRARRALDRVRRIAQRLAKTEACGDALALVASHALEVIDAP